MEYPNHAVDQTPLEVGPLGPRVGKHARPLRRGADRRLALAQRTSSSAATILEGCAARAHRTLQLCHLITKARQAVIWPACAGGINAPPTIHGLKPNTARARIGHGSGLLTDALPGVSLVVSGARSQQATGEAGRRHGCHPYALRIKTASVLVGGRLVGPSPGRVLPSKALLHT
jgi:hypothetical protein